MSRLAFPALSALLAAACSPWQTEGDYLYVRNDGADLPVWVRGDTGSGTVVVWLGSGPGDPVAIVHGEATLRLEEEVGMVYWDQRAAGSAQGNARPESFTIEQYVDDTDAVIDLVDEIYAPDRIFLLGHSWGGMLGTAYLADPEREARIAGWIDVDGNHDHPLIFPMKIAWQQAWAEQAIARGEDVEHWTEVRDWCASEPALTVENFARWAEQTDGTNAEFHDPGDGIALPADLLFRSAESLPAYVFVNAGYAKPSLYHDDEALRAMSYTDEMAGITLPSAMIWGRNDGIVPLDAALAAYEALGTPESDKRVVALDDSAHFPFLEEPDAFAEAVLDFVGSVP